MQPTQPTSGRAYLAVMLERLEELWAQFDTLCGDLQPEEWALPHGPDWTLADVPYHMYFFDQEFVAVPIARGPRVPPAQAIGLRSFREMHDWSAQWFARRPPGQTPAQSVAQMHAGRQAIRAAIAQLGDAEVDQPVWIDLVSTRGWRTPGFALWMCLIHTWNEFMQLRLYAGRTDPEPNPTTTHIALDGLVRIGQIFLDRRQAANAHFTLVREFSGPGGGAWTLTIDAGRCAVREGAAAEASLVIRQSVETFVRIFNDVLEPVAALQSGALWASDPAQLAMLSRLFPSPTPNQIIEPLPG